MMPDVDGFGVADEIMNRPTLGTPKMLLLSSAGRPGDAARCRDMGLSGFLLKPLRQSELFNAIATTVGAPEVAVPKRRELPSQLVSEAPKRILLAEDNPVNQALAVRLLEKWGHVLEVVQNGEEAVEAWEKGGFDVILMDVQMPVLGGFEATARIRELEAAHGGEHIPIIAMTAHALKGDRDRCLAAGMDGYVAKPIDPAELFGVLEDPEGAPAPPTASRAEICRIIDTEEILRRMGGDHELLQELSTMFLQSLPKQLEEVRAAVAAGDLGALGRVAHSLKGSTGNFSAHLAFEAAKQLETLARCAADDEEAGNLDTDRRAAVYEAAADVIREAERVQEVLTPLAAGERL
jgi:CheY-like chemotaxis protein